MDLIERINERLALMAAPPEWADKPVYVDAEPVRALLREAAAALEAAREDAERWRERYVAQLACYRQDLHGDMANDAIERAERTAARIADIDQARGKAEQEVGE